MRPSIFRQHKHLPRETDANPTRNPTRKNDDTDLEDAPCVTDLDPGSNDESGQDKHGYLDTNSVGLKSIAADNPIRAIIE